jgi:FtsP/CotA-like multicopper oxidase with cupredoxin domain
VTRGQRIGLIGAALVVAALAIVLLGGDDDEDTTPTTTSQPTLSQEPTASVPAPKPKPEPEFEAIRVVNGEPQGGVKGLAVDKGDTVRLEVRSDTPAEVHVHGYELKKDVEAGGSVRFQFKADIEGVFEIELEETHTQVAELTVEP